MPSWSAWIIARVKLEISGVADGRELLQGVVARLADAHLTERV